MIDFDALLLEHGAQLVELAAGIAGSRVEGEDVVQEAFLRAYRSRHGFRGDAQPHTWLRRIVVNLATDVRRRKKIARMHPAPDEAMPSREQGPAEAASEAERSEAVHRAIDALPPHQREVLVLREIGGLTYQEIADRLGLARGTVESRVLRGRERLRRQLLPQLGSGVEGGKQRARPGT